MANFLVFIPIVLDVEKGYQNQAADPGNYRSDGVRVGTNRGISAKVYEAWIGRLPSINDMKAISADTARAIYKAWYWDKLKADLISDQNVANIIVDMAVNSGPGAATRLLQETLNEHFGKTLAVDGAMGNLTIVATNSVNGQLLFDKIKMERKTFYESLDNPTYIEGWLNRLTHFVYEKKKK